MRWFREVGQWDKWIDGQLARQDGFAKRRSMSRRSLWNCAPAFDAWAASNALKGTMAAALNPGGVTKSPFRPDFPAGYSEFRFVLVSWSRYRLTILGSLFMNFSWVKA